MSQSVVYIAGPIRADNAWLREQNIRRAEALALEAWHAGAAAICPHAMGRFYDDGRYEMWIKGDLEILSRCDAILTVWNWEESVGACAEVDHAKRINMPVLHSIEELRAFLHKEEVSLDSVQGSSDAADYGDEEMPF